ncbi:MAG: radical SAM protein [Gemmatimonadota bacterium]|nr:MAG: radical SAM protein [Gemmatimonadota bacterium]
MKLFKIQDIIPQIPNLLFRRRFRFTFELLPFEVRELHLKKIWNFFYAGLNQFLLPVRPVGYPVIAQVEPVNFCNLSCPLCLTTLESDSRPKMALSFDTFKHFIDTIGDYLLFIVLWMNGEPFLHPDIFRMISYAKSKKVIVHTSTNGNVNFNEDQAAMLVECGLDSLVVGVDGASQETYTRYRRGGDLELVLRNIRTVIKVKQEKGSDTPLVNLRFIVMKHNENEIPAIKKLAEELQIDFLTFRTVASVKALETDFCRYYLPETRDYRGYENSAEKSRRKQKRFTCMRPWKRITLSASGEVIPCEYDYKNTHAFGALDTKESPLSIWKGKSGRDFRSKFNAGNNHYYLCRDCVYKDMVVDDCTVEIFRCTQTSEKK